MTPKYRNRLLKETSPYLKQHGHNPVDWYPWGDEALNKAKREDKPIFLSIGYSACHWCHVMERESFENEAIAKILNDHFVSIKVDREERPDLDQIYMSAVQVLTQRGGWPMSVFLTPGLKPFYGGTYFPPDDRMGMPGFAKTLMGVANAWKTKKAEILESASQLVGALQEMNATGQTRIPASVDLLAYAVKRTGENFDSACGGIGNAPKFFHTMDFRVCLRHWKKTKDPLALQMVTATLHHWWQGGIYDQLAGGFHRYSTDRVWLVPHFEKMLYDNALVTQLYLEAYQATKNPHFAKTAHETLDFILSDMTSKAGGYFSTLDADSEGVEGKFYVWSYEEVKTLLPPDVFETFAKIYNLEPHGNWEESNILHRILSWEKLARDLKTDTASLEETVAFCKRKLLAARKERVPPFLDEKILTSWNGLMIETMAHAAQVLGDSQYLESAEKAARFLLENLFYKDTLFHTFKDGLAQHPGFLDDYAALLNALVALYETTFNKEWLEHAEKFADKMLELFWEEKEKTFFYASKNDSSLILRPKEFQDGATPSATGLAVTALVKLGRMLSKDKYLKLATDALSEYGKMLQSYPGTGSQLLIALDLLAGDPQDIVIRFGTDEELNQEAVELLHRSFIPNRTLLKFDATWKNPHFQGREKQSQAPTVYFCKGFTCEAPIHSIEKLREVLSV